MNSYSKSKEAIKKFVEEWTGKGDEKGQSQTFWLQLLHDVLGVENPYNMISFESRVKLSHTSFIDAYIPNTKVLIVGMNGDRNIQITWFSMRS